MRADLKVKNGILDDDLDEAKFSKYIELFAIKSADEIAAALLPAKG